MADLINARYLLGISPENEGICQALGLTAANIDDPLLITADVVVVIASAKTGIDPKIVSQWHTFRDLYVPAIVAIIDFQDGDVDFEDMSAIVGKMLEPVLTPYLVLHLENQMITDYSLAPSVIKDSDSEHKELISEFRSELQEALIEGGWEQFAAGLVIPAIPLILSNKLGVNEIQKFLDLIPTRG
jgi:hypothetical protein